MGRKKSAPKVQDVSLSTAANTSPEILRSQLLKLQLESGPEDFLEQINLRVSSQGLSPLHYACSRGHPESVRMLLEAGADCNSISEGTKYDIACTPLSHACWSAAMKNLRKSSIADYLKCVKILLKHPNFDVPLHNKLGLICCCVISNGEYGDILIDFLKELLYRGFDPNSRLRGSTCLYFALAFGHKQCARFLVRHGANIYTTTEVQPEDKTKRPFQENCLETCLQYLGKEFALELQDSYEAARAIMSPKRRQRLLNGGAAGKLGSATRLIKGAKHLLAAGYFQDAFTHLWEAALIGAELDRQSRFMVFHDLIALNYHLRGRGSQANRFADELTKGFPNDPIAKLQYAGTVFHPDVAVIDDQSIKRVKVIINVIQHQIDTGAPLRFAVDSFRKKDVKKRLGYIKDALAKYESRLQCPIYRAERQAIAEIRKKQNTNASIVIERVRNDGHELTPRLQFAKGRVLLAEAWEFFDVIEKDLNAALKDTSVSLASPSWTGVIEKTGAALEAFQSCVGHEDLDFPLECAEWHRFFVQANLGPLDGIQDFAKQVMELVLEGRRAGIDLTCTGTESFCSEPSFSSSFDLAGDISGALKFQKNHIYHIALQDMQYTSETTTSTSLEETTAFHPLDEAVSCGLLSSTFRDGIKTRITGGYLQEESVRAAWEKAVARFKIVDDTFKAIRSTFASAVIEHGLEIKRTRCCSQRVLGKIVQEALTWDSKVRVPEELKESNLKLLPPKRCYECSSANPMHSCPCHEAHFCGEECQARAWDRHKVTCSARVKKVKKEGTDDAS